MIPQAKIAQRRENRRIHNGFYRKDIDELSRWIIYILLSIIVFLGFSVVAISKSKQKDYASCKVAIEEFKECKDNMDCHLDSQLHARFLKCL
jgi:hypothetical protein